VGSLAITAWLTTEVIASTAYHKTSRFTVAGEPVKPTVPRELTYDAPVAPALVVHAVCYMSGSAF